MKEFFTEFFVTMWRIDMIAPIVLIVVATIVLIFVLAFLAEAFGLITKEEQNNSGLPWPQRRHTRLEPEFVPILQEEKGMVEDERGQQAQVDASHPKKKKIALVVAGGHTEISRFRKGFVERFSVWDKDALLFVTDPKEADIVITIVVKSHFDRNPRMSKIIFHYEGWIASDAAAFGAIQVEYLLMSYGDDEKQLFKKAARDIADSLLREYKAVKPTEEIV